jgi:hypothetical protein
LVFSVCASGGGPAPAEFYTLALSDEEKVVSDLFEVFVEEG